MPRTSLRNWMGHTLVCFGGGFAVMLVIWFVLHSVLLGGTAGIAASSFLGSFRGRL